MAVQGRAALGTARRMDKPTLRIRLTGALARQNLMIQYTDKAGTLPSKSV